MNKRRKIFFWTLILFLVFSQAIGSIFVFNENIKDVVSSTGLFKNRLFESDHRENRIFGGIIPHHLMVDWAIDDFFVGLEGEEYDTIVLVGPDHFGAAREYVTSCINNFEIENGEVLVDKEAIDFLAKKKMLDVYDKPFKNEHSILGILPFIKKYFPESEVLPIILSSNVKQNNLDDLVSLLPEALASKKVLVLASVDFSHYQPAMVAEFHDAKSNQTIRSFDLDDLWGLEVDSPGSLYLAMSYLLGIGAEEAQLISHTNSSLLIKFPDDPSTSHNIFYFRKGEKDSTKAINYLFFGDLMMDRYVKDEIGENGIGTLMNVLAGEEERFFMGVDFTSANLEGVFTEGGNHYTPIKTYDFAFEPKHLEDLKKYNFNFFNLANNHEADQGEQGYKENIEFLEQEEILYSGCYGKWKKDCGIEIIEKNDKKIAMIGIDMLYSRKEIKNIVSLIKEVEADYLIVNIHWGVEYDKKSSSEQKEVAYNLIDAGVDLIIGHHPHVIQEFEIYNNKPIFYSLGNFIFDQPFSKDTKQGLAVGAVLTEKLEIFIFPFESNNWKPGLLAGNKKKEVLMEISKDITDEGLREAIESGRIVLDI